MPPTVLCGALQVRRARCGRTQRSGTVRLNFAGVAETRIAKIVATTAEGTIIPPCGRCRELLYQIDEANIDTTVLIGDGSRSALRELLPYNWQPRFDKPLA